ncbi:MAG: flagellar hook-length control protein FliK [Rhodoferax sp.]|uniref:flagellar hook-length control protein FliK n=1 Tax=Rhodoferax sp. TaxID=50421 RepID=UPI00271A1C6D|nr:flagellar hook-length control protein FliK [Rhodoferax sp.]MDO8450757.1 flagellar hook-length control protein FliK [Rhodoferax sp.]
MSMERSGAATSAKAVAGTESHVGKGKVKAGDDTDAAAAGGFFAILTSLEPSVEQGAEDATLVATDGLPQAAAAPASGPAIALVASTPDLPTDLAMLLTQAGEHGGDKLTAPVDAGSSMAKVGLRLRASAMGAEKPEIAVAASASPGSDKSGEVKQGAEVLLEQMAQGLPAQHQKALGAQLQADTAARLAESRTLKQASLADGLGREPALSGALLTAGIGDSVLRQADRTMPKSSLLSTGNGVEGIWGQQAFQAGGRVDAPSVMADPSTLSLESMVADTVSYWVALGVQNAELKLDGFGDHPVEVSISLKGEAAHIDFRTDQPEIRKLLEGATAHLKDLLTSEGLVLSGVSVGASGQDGTGAQDQRNRPGARQATITSTEALPAAKAMPRASQSVGRAVDLFV